MPSSPACHSIWAMVVRWGESGSFHGTELAPWDRGGAVMEQNGAEAALKSGDSTRLRSPAWGWLPWKGPGPRSPRLHRSNAIVPLCFIFHFHAKLAIPAAVVWGLPVHIPHLVLFSRCLSSVCVCHFLSPSKSHLHTSTEVYYFFFSSPKSFCSFLTCWKMSLLEPTSNIFSVFLSPIFFCSSSFVHILIIPSPNYQDKWGKARMDDGDQQRGWSTGLRWCQWRWRTVDKLC